MDYANLSLIEKIRFLKTMPDDPIDRPVEASPPQLTLSVRRPSELVAMEFSQEDLFLDCGILAKGQGMTILGPGGVGKSRLALQLSASLILGQPFLGMDVNCERLKILILQTENPNRRLSFDLSKMRSAWNENEWGLIDEHLLMHTVENDSNHTLSLTDFDNAAAIARLVKEHKPDVVFFDPLYAFAAGNLNQDAGMIKTVTELSKLARLGNPEAAIVILHHTLTGKAGAMKAMGEDRASYGRGSKTIHSWARGQLNIAEHPWEKGSILVACGKNSNGSEFEPFAARLNRNTFLYERDTTFAMPEEDHGGQVKLTPAKVASYVKDVPLKQKDLVKALMDDTGCAKSKAYAAIREATRRTIVYNQNRELAPIEPKPKPEPLRLVK